MTKTKIFAIVAIVGFLIAGIPFSFAQDAIMDNLNDDLRAAKAIPDWVDNNFRWYGEGLIQQSDLLNSLSFLLDNGHMHLSDKAAKEVHDLRTENAALKKKLGSDGIVGPKTASDNPSPGSQVQPSQNPVIVMPASNEEAIKHLRKAYDLNPNLETKVVQYDKDHDKWIDVLSIDFGTSMAKQTPKTDFGTAMKQGATEGLSVDKFERATKSDSQKITFTGLESASKSVQALVSSGKTSTTDWNNVISKLASKQSSQTTDSVVDDLQGIVVLCNTAIDKEIQKIEAEVALIEDLDNRKSDDPTRSTSQYNESDLEFIQRHAARIDSKIQSLQTGLKVLDATIEREMKESGEKGGTQDINIGVGELQEAMQKQQQTLQTLSNIMKTKHDTAKAAINNVR